MALKLFSFEAFFIAVSCRLLKITKNNNSPMRKPTSVSNAAHYQWGNLCDGWHLAKSDKLSVIQESVPAGCSEVMHLHTVAEQFFYILSGTATIQLQDQVLILESGQGLHIMPQTPHQLRNHHTETLKFLVVSTPDSHQDRVEVVC